MSFHVRASMLLLLGVLVASGAEAQPQSKGAESQVNPFIERSEIGLIANNYSDFIKKKTEKREESALRAQWEAANAGKSQAESAFWQVVIGILTTIAALGGTIYIVRTFRATRDAVGAAQESAKEARRAADAAEQGVVVATQSNQIQMGAYVHINQVNSQRYIDDKGNVVGHVCRVVWKNFGSTPAVQVRAKVSSMGWMTNKLPPWFPFPIFSRLYGYDQGNPGSIAPGGELSVSTEQIPDAYLSDIRKNWLILFFWGYVEYQDIFGHNHVVRFKYRSDGTYRSDDGIERISFVFYDNGIIIDDDCRKEDVDRPCVPNNVINFLRKHGSIPLGYMMWVNSQLPSTFERYPDWTPFDQSKRDEFGVRIE